MKLDAVVIAADEGSCRARCLQPMGSQTLLSSAVNGLRAIGIQRMIILASGAHETDIKQYCHEKFALIKDISLEYFFLPSDTDNGTAEAIYSIRDRIRGDFIVHACDSFIDPRALSCLLNHFRLHDPLFTMLLINKPPPGKKDKVQSMRDFIGLVPLDEAGSPTNEDYSANRLVFIQPEVTDLEGDLDMSEKVMLSFPTFQIHSTFLDTQAYIFKRDVLEFMSRNQDKTELKTDLIPALVADQIFERKLIDEDNMDYEVAPKTFDYEAELRDWLETLNPRNIALYPQKVRASKSSSCHAIVVKNMGKSTNKVSSNLS